MPNPQTSLANPHRHQFNLNSKEICPAAGAQKLQNWIDNIGIGDAPWVTINGIRFQVFRTAKQEWSWAEGHESDPKVLTGLLMADSGWLS